VSGGSLAPDGETGGGRSGKKNGQIKTENLSYDGVGNFMTTTERQPWGQGEGCPQVVLGKETAEAHIKKREGEQEFNQWLVITETSYLEKGSPRKDRSDSKGDIRNARVMEAASKKRKKRLLAKRQKKPSKSNKQT